MENTTNHIKSSLPLSKFIPFFLLEIVLTSTMGSMGAAISNYLISELNYDPWVGGLVVSLASVGFLIFTLAFGHISDKFGQRKVIIIIMAVKLGLSFYYLVPIDSYVHLIIFGGVFFLDGAISGIFWPTIQQISVHAERNGSSNLKNKYMSGYNFSWNFGYILGMIMGALIVYVFTSNYYVFYFNLFGMIMGALIAFFFVKNVSEMFDSYSDKPISSPDTPPETIDMKNNKIENEAGSRLSNLPLYSFLIILLIHSLTDGLITIFLTLKIELLNYGLYWVFIITLIKLFFQMSGTIIFSFTKKSLIIKILLISISVIGFSWTFILFGNNLWSIALLLSISGFAQGAIYALIMKLISYKADKQESARPFSYFQAIMSGGRMMGSIMFGLTAAISLSLGIYILIAYTSFSFVQFILSLKFSTNALKK